MQQRRTWIDISVPVAPGQTPVWPGGPAVIFEQRLSLKRGDPVNDTTLKCSVHTGTHVDAPSHFLEDGLTVDSLALDALVGPCRVLDLTGQSTVDRTDIADQILRSSERVLLKTDNSDRWSAQFYSDFTGLTVDAARSLVEADVRLVGIDYLSVQPFNGSDEVHRILLAAGVVLLEGIDLSNVAPAQYELYCLPMKLSGVEAAPARALLRPVSNSESLSEEVL